MRKVLSWDEYFMSLAHLSAVRSKDPSTQVGAVIVDSSNRVVGLGYNGFPRGCDDEKFPWEREGEFLDTKYAYVVHAELNAILNSKAIIQSGIKEIIYESDKYKDLDNFKASKRMLEEAGIKLRQLDYEIDLDIKINKKN